MNQSHVSNESALPPAAQEPIIIAGPCALYPQDTHPKQVSVLLKWATGNSISLIRAPYWKPRTKPGGFDGIGLEKALPIYIEMAKEGFTPATEVRCTKDAVQIVQAFKSLNLPIILWIGARRQDNNEQEALAALANSYSRLTVMYKNQPWPDINHTVGIWEYATKESHGNAPKGQVIIANRGYAHDRNGANEMRNDPREDLVEEIFAQTKATMIADPSHIGGSIPLVLSYLESLTTPKRKQIYKGIILEVHPVDIEGVAPALTDTKQQLPYDIASEAIQFYRKKYAQVEQRKSLKSKTSITLLQKETDLVKRN